MGPNSSSGWDSADNQQRFPRIYSATDGLRTTDEDEDCTFVVWKKKAEHLRLGKAGNLRVFRARSKVSFVGGEGEGGADGYARRLRGTSGFLRSIRRSRRCSRGSGRRARTA